jgi:hypothetical protein
MPRNVQEILNELFAADGLPPRPLERLVGRWERACVEGQPAQYDEFVDCLFIRERLSNLLSAIEHEAAEAPAETVRRIRDADAVFRAATRPTQSSLGPGEGWWWWRVPTNVDSRFAQVIRGRGL